MIKSVFNHPISQLFDTEARLIYTIPRYQREYTWSTPHWDSLFDDVRDNGPGYFLGSIICINQSNNALDIQQLEVVDGQQRLTTLSLLFAAVYSVVKSHYDELDEDQRLELANLKRKLVLKNTTDQIRVIPQIQNQNLKDYRAVLSLIGIIEAETMPPNAGNRRVLRAFRYFTKRLTELTNDKQSSVVAASEFLQKVSQATIVKIEVASHADAYILFEALNDRGTPLTAVDLIKNKLLAKLETLDRNRIDFYFGHWNSLLEYLGEDYATQERFFRQYYNAFRDDLKTIIEVPVATRTNLMVVFEKLIDNDPKGCLQKLEAAGRLYSVFLNRTEDDSLYAIDRPLLDLERIQGAPAYVLLLHILSRKVELGLTDKHLSDIVNLLVRFFVRRNLTDTPPTRDLTRMFMSIIENLKGKSGDEVVSVIQETIIARSESDETFRTKLNGAIYEENSGVARFILTTIAEESMTKESQIDLWRREKKLFVWTIEHILPQGENIPDSWVQMIADGDKQIAKLLQEKHVHRLGNLTISGFNSALGNKSFLDKRDRTNRQGQMVGYKNGLNLNAQLAIADHWGMDQIEARGEKLIEKAMELFKLEIPDTKSA